MSIQPDSSDLSSRLLALSYGLGSSDVQDITRAWYVLSRQQLLPVLSSNGDSPNDLANYVRNLLQDYGSVDHVFERNYKEIALGTLLAYACSQNPTPSLKKLTPFTIHDGLRKRLELTAEYLYDAEKIAFWGDEPAIAQFVLEMFQKVIRQPVPSQRP